jgi:O-antigen/teichoic acid export membrane protein
MAIAPRKSPVERAKIVGYLGASQTRFLRRLALLLLVIPAAAFVLRLWSASIALAAAGTILAGWAALQREYRRSVLLIYARPQGMLQADCVYVLVMLVGIALALLSRSLAGPAAIGALIAAAWACATVAHRMLAADPGWKSGDARPFWQEIRSVGLWSAVGAVIYWLFAQSYNYVLATRLDLTAVTNVNAARLVLMPIFVFMYGVNTLLTSTASNWLAEFGLSRMLRRMAVIAVLISAIDLSYFAIAWNLRHWLIGDLMHKTISDQDRLLILWGCVALVFLPREVLQASLYALKRVKSMARIVGLSAVVSLSLMWFGIPHWGAAAVLIGQVAGESVNLMGLAWLLWRHANPQTAPT